jgi:hypothetical protein
MRMTGHGHEITNLSELLELLSQHTMTSSKPKDHASFIAEAIKDAELNIRISEGIIGVLKKEPPEPGAKLVMLDALKPYDREKYGFATIATYALPSGAYRVIGTDHLTQDVVDHTALNEHGVDGLVESVKQEVAKRSIEAADAKDAAQPAEEGDLAPPGDVVH